MKEERGLRGLNRQFTKEYLTLTEENKAFVKKMNKPYQELLEDNMQKLKRGDFVWSKEYGNGLVYEIEGWAHGILFEGNDYLIHSARSELFAKGDEVEAGEREHHRKIPKGIFLGMSPISNDCNLVIEDETDKRNYLFVTDIKHKPITQLKIILTLNGKEIDAKAISRETWDNLRCL